MNDELFHEIQNLAQSNNIIHLRLSTSLLLFMVKNEFKVPVEYIRNLYEQFKDINDKFVKKNLNLMMSRFDDSIKISELSFWTLVKLPFTNETSKNFIFFVISGYCYNLLRWYFRVKSLTQINKSMTIYKYVFPFI